MKIFNTPPSAAKPIKPFRILSISGGGLRGVIPAKILAELEASTGKRINESFDLIVGSSIGGILALALTAPTRLTADTMVSLFQHKAQTIFPPGGKALFGPKYDGLGLQETLNMVLGNLVLPQHTPVAVTAFNLRTQSPVIFSSSSLVKERSLDAALATSAGPTFFPAHMDMVDGGTIANNPSVVAISQAIAKYGAKLENIQMPHLATGRYAPGQEQLMHGGQLAWATQIAQTTIDGNSTLCDIISSRMLGDRFMSINPVLEEGHTDMDNADPENVEYLLNLGEWTWRKEKEKIISFLR